MHWALLYCIQRRRRRFVVVELIMFANVCKHTHTHTVGQSVFCVMSSWVPHCWDQSMRCTRGLTTYQNNLNIFNCIVYWFSAAGANALLSIRDELSFSVYFYRWNWCALKHTLVGGILITVECACVQLIFFSAYHYNCMLLFFVFLFLLSSPIFSNALCNVLCAKLCDYQCLCVLVA